MDVGMLWLDDNKNRSLQQKLERASLYYEEKYGRFPNLCYVHQSSLEQERTVGEILLIPDPQIQPNCFLLGCQTQ